MKIKELKEQKNALIEKMQTMVNSCETETRNLTDDENVEFQSLEAEVRAIETKITELKEEKRNSEILVEDTKNIEERGNVNMELTRENEIRGLEAYIRKQDNEELRAMDTTSTGAVIPTFLHTEVIKKLEEVAPVFSQARLFTPVGGKLDLLAEDTIGAGAFVGENADLTAEDFKVEKVTLNAHRAGATIQLSQHLINDAGIDVVSYATDILIRRLGAVLNRTIINGQVGEDQPEGLLYAPKKCEVEAASKSAISLDDVLELYNSMNPEFIDGACFIVSRKEFNKLVKLKDATGNFYVVRDFSNAGAMYKLLGLPVFISDVMPENTGAGEEKVMILANIPAAYAVMINKNVELKTVTGDTTQALRGSQLLVMDCYVDGKIVNNQAIRILKTPQ